MAYLGNSPVLSQQEYRNIDDISGSFNGVTTSFALLVNGVAPIPGPQTSNQCLISVNGVIQKPDDTGASGFRISGGNIVFSSAPTGGQTFFGVILAGADYIYAGENFPDGTVSAPTITFAQDLDTGFYRSGAGEVKFTANGVNTVTFSSNGLTAPNFIPSGSSVPTNGVYLPSANNVAIATNSTQRLLIDSSGQIEAVSLGSAAAPTWSFTTDPNTGIYSPGADQVAITTGGTARLTSSTTAVTSALPIDHPLGSAAAPTVTFTGDLNTGIYSPGADQLAISTNGTRRFQVSSDGTINVFGANKTPSGGGNSVIYATDTQAVDVGGSIAFGGYYIGTSSDTEWAQIAGRKENSTSGNYAGYLQFSTRANGGSTTERLRITSAGLVGIGTTSPSEKLHVAGNLYVAGGDIYIDTAKMISTSNANPLRFGIGQSEKAQIDGSGRLLVGTSSSLTGGSSQYARLQVNGNSSGIAGVIAVGANVASTAVGAGQGVGYLMFTDNGAGQYAWIGAENDGTSSSSSDTPGRLVFSTTADGASSPTERMRISSTGTHDLYGLNDTIYSRTNRGAGTTYVTFAGVHSATGTGTGTASCYIYSNGNIQNTNGSYTTLSDVKLKENIVDAGSQWDDLKAIQIRNWNFKAETGHETHRQIGPIAQELETVCPGLVFETPDRDADGNETGEVTKGVNQSVLYMKAVKALQEAMERIEQLEAEMAEIKAQLS